jgi:maltooligosyltrehalose trehalohydrolase
MNRWGAVKVAQDRYRFSLWAPAQSSVILEILGRDPIIMDPLGDGWFGVECRALPGARYRFSITPDLTIADPASRAQADDVHGASLVVDPDAYAWQTDGWRGRPWNEVVIYEVHAGLLGGFAGVERQFDRLASLGVTAIELMPIAEFSGTRSWGYDGVLPYAPARAYGSPDELKALVDAAHQRGLMVLLDVVYNHFGPDGNYLGTYAPEFVHPETHTPWGAAIAFDREPVRRFFIDNALMWLNEYRFDGLRFDAVHAINDADFLQAMATELRGATGDRHVHLILENEANDPALIEAGYTAQWNDDFHNVMHVLLTEETGAYYADFAEGPTQKLARCLEEGFIYQGEPLPRNGSKRGKPSGHLPPTAFVAFLQNHDQVGNRALGERLTLLTSRDELHAATALLLLCPQIPLLFMGDEVGARSPFLYFTDFHDALAEAVREGRREEFAGFSAFADPETREAIPDPNALETFRQSRIVPGPDAEAWMAFYRELLALRHEHIVPRLAGTKAISAEVMGDKAVLAGWRMGDGGRLSILLNLGHEAIPMGEFPGGKPLFAFRVAGSSQSCAVWLEAEE